MSKNNSSRADNIIVVDASYIISLLLPDEETRHKNVPQQMLAPHLLDFEVANGLKSAVNQKRIKEELAIALFAEYQKLPISKKITDCAVTISVALEKKLSVYDACYLVLAQTFGVRLLSLDKSLLKS
jgi:predicted nucleic acid-binding protein